MTFKVRPWSRPA